MDCVFTGLEGGGVWDDAPLDYPAFAPFTAAGYFVAHSDFLHEVPFDPFLPWIFMGEEIIMSTRLWTSGYDIFSPTRSVVGHMYVRRHKPKVREHRFYRAACGQSSHYVWSRCVSFGRVFIGKYLLQFWPQNTAVAFLVKFS